jgi:hypothetical protein
MQASGKEFREGRASYMWFLATPAVINSSGNDNPFASARPFIVLATVDYLSGKRSAAAVLGIALLQCWKTIA